MIGSYNKSRVKILKSMVSFPGKQGICAYVLAYFTLFVPIRIPSADHGVNNHNFSLRLRDLFLADFCFGNLVPIGVYDFAALFCSLFFSRSIGIALSMIERLEFL